MRIMPQHELDFAVDHLNIASRRPGRLTAPPIGGFTRPARTAGGEIEAELPLSSLGFASFIEPLRCLPRADCPRWLLCASRAACHDSAAAASALILSARVRRFSPSIYRVGRLER